MKKINEVNKIVGVSKRTLQFYDDEGLIKAKRSESNYRLYDERALKDLWEVVLYKEIGMELKEIKKVLLMSEDEKKEFYKKYIKNLKSKIQELQEQERFIFWIMIKGVPTMPTEQSDITYKSKISELIKEARL